MNSWCSIIEPAPSCNMLCSASVDRFNSLTERPGSKATNQFRIQRGGWPLHSVEGCRSTAWDLEIGSVKFAAGPNGKNRQ